MDRIEAYEEEIESESTTALQSLNLPSLSRFHIKPASNIEHERNKALADEIKQAWGIPIPRIMKIIRTKGYQFTLQTFNEVKKNPNARNPAALFLWTISNCKVELKEV